ncbi:PrgI family protein (plasmid) [Bacillus methanolicus]|uniref:PrgI family mobile element protein n=1 Tax=Bacillus methanolicus TaxID=1471 RepID=UPI00238054E8|nr:PrgI family protein [Bacillus methanolicus]MDE3841023.1 PrgI family protein [Bacillus methanolicus]
MRKVTVPIDMASEQKTILGIFSKRQLIYLVTGGAILYAYIPTVFQFFSNLFVGFILSVISAIPILAAVFILGFLKKQKLHLNYDKYFLIKIGYKNQIGIWRKGSKPKDWMVNK